MSKKPTRDTQAFTRHELSIAEDRKHDIILSRWRWFRTWVMTLHGMSDLAETFGEDEGDISHNEAVSEDDPRYDFVAPEYNYHWHTQHIAYTSGPHRVAVCINNDALYSGS